MAKTFQSICLLVSGVLSRQAWTAPADIQVVTRPERPFIERRGTEQIVNFDILIRNNTDATYRLIAIKLSIFDSSGRLEFKRELNENGKPPALDMVGDRLLSTGAVMDVYQPFFSFASDVHLARMHFELQFIKAGQAAPPVSVGADQTTSIDVLPREYQPAAFCLPMRGLLLVHDGHDFYSHHRRYSLAKRYIADSNAAVAANLYAYDFVRTTQEGALFSGDPHRKENWLSYGELIVAPADGVVLEAVSKLAENTFDSMGYALSPPGEEASDPDGLGNHLTIQHPDGRISWMLHMQPGSLRVEVGDRVRAGQVIGKVGFTGDSLFPHLHYTVTDAATYPAQGVPTYFRHYARIMGRQRIDRVRGQVDTGDLVENVGQCQ